MGGRRELPGFLMVPSLILMAFMLGLIGSAMRFGFSEVKGLGLGIAIAIAGFGTLRGSMIVFFDLARGLGRVSVGGLPGGLGTFLLLRNSVRMSPTLSASFMSWVVIVNAGSLLRFSNLGWNVVGLSFKLFMMVESPPLLLSNTNGLNALGWPGWIFGALKLIFRLNPAVVDGMGLALGSTGLAARKFGANTGLLSPSPTMPGFLSSNFVAGGGPKFKFSGLDPSFCKGKFLFMGKFKNAGFDTTGILWADCCGGMGGLGGVSSTRNGKISSSMTGVGLLTLGVCSETWIDGTISCCGLGSITGCESSHTFDFLATSVAPKSVTFDLILRSVL